MPISDVIREKRKAIGLTQEQVAERLAQLAQPGDLILTVGAGDIFRAGELLLAGQEKGPAGN